MALGMTMNGAHGETFEAMRSTLGFGALELQKINASYRTLMALLVDLDPNVKVAIANSIWYRHTLVPQRTFLDDVKGAFQARVEPLDFDDPKSPGVINAWVKEATKGRIPTIIDGEIRSEDIMFLINAIHFKAPWTHRFDARDTRVAPFTLADGSQRSVRMMANPKAGVRLVHSDGVTIADIPYAGGAYSMAILLPERGRTLDDLVASLDAATWEGWMEKLGELRGIDLRLPRFRLEYKVKLNDALKAMGMGRAFSGADFSRMYAGGGVAISTVLQKTFVEVNEEGTEAAAVTKVGMGLVSMPQPFSVDRPFLVAIRERFSGTILFIGKVMDPTAG
jgi:serpin B